MKFKQSKNLVEYTVNAKLSYIRDNYTWYKNEDGILFQVSENKEIEQLNKAELELKK
ncbi:MAG: hypothetical protein QG594_2410 [Bacteroidota bacterium]|nr:hypothetical protein [Bacteroidota bacterium]